MSAKCRNDVLLEKIYAKKIKETDEVTFAVLSDLPDCRNIKLDSGIDVTGTGNYNPRRRPANMFECMKEGCVNTGTLFMTPAAGETAVGATFKIAYDANDYANGVLTVYVYKADGATFPVTGSITVGTAADLADADVYAFSLEESAFDAAGYAPVVINFLDTPTSVEGNGWEASATGAYIRLDGTNGVGGFSSLALFESIEDFETSDVVKIACLSSIEGDLEIEAAEATCTQGGYNTSEAPTFEKTITGKLLTPNFDKLNPFSGKTDRVDAFRNRATEQTIVAEGNYGVVVLPDVNQNECGLIKADLIDCDKTEAQLVRLGVPVLLDMDEKHFIVINNADGTTKVYFNQFLVGEKVKIGYPQLTTGETYADSLDNVGSKRVRMSYEKEMSDGTRYVYTYNNVLITSFPDSWSNEDDAEVEFGVTIQIDADGHYRYRTRITG